MRLSRRELNRATLERQLLLRRSELPLVTAVERLGGLNAQDPNLPYLALWNRLESFAVEDLTAAIEDGRLVRSVLMRATQRLVTATDFGLYRPAVAPLLRRVHRNVWGARTAGIDLDRLVADARDLLAGGKVLPRPELGRLLTERHPGATHTALGWSLQYLEPIVHPAPSGTWNTRGPTLYARADEMLGADVRREASAADVRELARRYLAAYGPATASDARAWSGVSGLREIFDQLRPELRTFADESGRELFDLPDAPRPGADVEAPVRFVPAFDEPLLAYADRTRIMTDEVRRRICVGDAVHPAVLVDGAVRASWELTANDGVATLTVRPFDGWSRTDRAAVEDEAAGLLAFAAADADRHDLRYS
jgi:hypothetical protein